MRKKLGCPGLWHFSLVNNGRAPRLTLGVLILVACICIIGFTYIETQSIAKQTLASNKHVLAKKKISVDVATDVTNKALHYGVVVDCGSSGSRVFVYFWPPHDGDANELLQIQQMRDKNRELVVKKIKPGISSFADKPSEASEYIKPLLQFAADHVPKDKHKETPLYIMATAGMRMLPESQQRAILDDLRVDIPMDFHFLFGERHVEVITGKQEGVYSWVAINYVQGRFDHTYGGDDPLVTVELQGSGEDSRMHVRKQTIGIMDMGGGSAQIAFEVLRPEDIAKSLLAEFNLGCKNTDRDHTYRVYVTTFLGFGGDATRRRYEQSLIQQALNVTDGLQGTTEARAIVDPCLPLDMIDTITNGSTKYYLRGTGDYPECQERAKPLLNRSAPCMKHPCSMNGVYQPKINFRNSEFVGFSEFYYSMEDVFRIGGNYEYLKFNNAAKEYCSTKWSTLLHRYKRKLYPKADFNRFRLQCFKAAWITTVLHEGYKLPRLYRKFTSAKLIDGKEVQWTLGALLYKTRFYPLRAIEEHEKSQQYRPPWKRTRLHYAQYLLLVCFVIVVAAILIYIRRLRIVPQATASLSRVPSMTYFMTTDDQAMQGIDIQNFP